MLKFGDLKILGFIFCILLSMSMVCHGQNVDSLTYCIQFVHNSSVVDTACAENVSAISRFVYDLDSLRRSSEVDILQITARGCSSWEGSYTSNLHLSTQRTRAVAGHIKSRFGVDLAMKESYDFESEIINLVSASGSDYKDKVLPILKSSGTNDRKTLALKGLDSGRCWQWLNSSVFPLQRRVNIVIKYSVREKVTTTPVVSEPPVQTELPMKTEESVLTIVAQPADALLSANPAAAELLNADTTSKVHFLSLKNNLLYDIALVANIGLETDLGRRFSFDLPFAYSPYNISRNYRMRVLSLQPELRWWLKEGWSGHFFGFDINFSYYNVVTPFNTKTRYQDMCGNTPLIGAGLSYGYSMPLSRDGKWGMEFTLGLGYAHLKYDCFYNVHNGALYSEGCRNWWGPTKAGINIFYRFTFRRTKRVEE